MKTTLIRGARALLGETFAPSRGAVDLLVRDRTIAAIEPAGTLPGADTIVELPDHLVCPGFINGHLHSHEHFQRGRTENLPLELWQQFVRTPTPIPVTPAQVYLRTLIGAIECLRTGATCVVDDLRVRDAQSIEYVDAVLRAYEDIGVRAMVGFSMMDRPIVDSFPALGLLPPDLVARMRTIPQPDARAYLDLVRRLAGERHPASARVGVIVSASAPQRCTEEFLRDCRRLADDLDLPVITHVQETRLQVVTGMEFYGCAVVEYLDRIGFLKPKTSMIHAVYLNPREIDALARTGATAQHNPWSNLMLGSGVQPVRALLDAGVNVSMGSDGSCSTVTVNMLNVLGTAAALSKVRDPDYTRWLTAREALAAATTGGARALGHEGRLGVLAVGAIADFGAYRTDTVAFTPPSDPVRQLVYAERGAGLDFVMVDGEVVMRDGALTRIDERRVLAQAAQAMAELQPLVEAGERSGEEIRQAMEAIVRHGTTAAIPPDTHPARIGGIA